MLIPLLILITPVASSRYLWGILMGVQALVLFLHRAKLNERILEHLIAVLREIQILFAVTFLFAI